MNRAMLEHINSEFSLDTPLPLMMVSFTAQGFKGSPPRLSCPGGLLNSLLGSIYF